MRKRVVKKPPGHAQSLVLNSRGHNMTDAQLLREALAEAKAWHAEIKAGTTRPARKEPVRSSGCGGTETPIAHLPKNVRIALADQLYAIDSGAE